MISPGLHVHDAIGMNGFIWMMRDMHNSGARARNHQNAHNFGAADSSSMAVGSSNTSIAGFMASMPAMEARCCCPPLIRVGSDWRKFAKPTACNESTIRLADELALQPEILRAKGHVISNTVVTS